MKGGHFGNAGNWAANARRIGFTLDQQRAVNAVTQIGGHVAIVKSVSTRGTITLEEYNWGSSGRYRQLTLSASAPDCCIHIAAARAAEALDESDDDRSMDSPFDTEQENPAPAETSSELTACT